MKSWNIEHHHGAQYSEAIKCFESGKTLYKIWRNYREPHTVVRLTNRADIFPGRALFTNYWFAHAYCCKLNEARESKK